MDQNVFGAKEEEDEGAPAWVVTFGDLMSLLLCFFVLMLSFSEMDRRKYKVVSGSVKMAFGVQRKVPVFESPKGQKMIAREFDQAIALTRFEKDVVDPLTDELNNNFKGLKNQVEIEVSEDQVKVRLMGETTFDTGKAEIRPEFRPLLLKIGSMLEKTAGTVIVSGHTDNVPLIGGPFKTNLGLSIGRAASVAEFLLQHTSINPARISTMGFGEHRPLAPNGTPEGRQRNRRVEIILSS
ncbi:MAG: OmpA family protein [Desulfobacterales bacterium]|nr:MAG: OmpA family protein [Desulfobacterales bacterium]